RIRHGNWRAVCRIDREAETVILERVDHRGDMPMSEKIDTVTLSRAEYEALIERIEDAEDNAFLDSVEVREQAIGKEGARADYLPAELVRRLIDGEHPIGVWRAHRRLSRDALAAAAGMSPSY